MPTPEVLGRNGTYVVFRKLHTKVAAYRRYLRDRAAEPRGGGPARREDGRALAERSAARARRPTGDDPELGGDAAAQQRLRLRRRPAWLQVPGRRPRPSGQPARRVRSRRQRRRPAPPDDPARHQLRPDAARGRARGRRGRPRDRLRLRRRPPQAAVRVRQDPVAQRRHLHRCPAREGPARRTERRDRQASPSRSARSGAGCRTCRRSSSPGAASTASPPACARCGGWRSWTHDRPSPERGSMDELIKHRPLEGARLRPAGARCRGDRAARAPRLPVRRSGRRDHPQPAPRRQRHHHRDGRAADRGRRGDRGPHRGPGRRS